MANDFAKELVKAMKEYTDEVKEDIEKEVDSASENIIEELKASSPKRSGSYRAGWRCKKANNINNVKVIYNKTDYQLTHLLEKGHQNRDGGRTQGKEHIKPVEEKYMSELARNITYIIRGRDR